MKEYCAQYIYIYHSKIHRQEETMVSLEKYNITATAVVLNAILVYFESTWSGIELGYQRFDTHLISKSEFREKYY